MNSGNYLLKAKRLLELGDYSGFEREIDNAVQNAKTSLGRVEFYELAILWCAERFDTDGRGERISRLVKKLDEAESNLNLSEIFNWVWREGGSKTVEV